MHQLNEGRTVHEGDIVTAIIALISGSYNDTLPATIAAIGLPVTTLWHRPAYCLMAAVGSGTFVCGVASWFIIHMNVLASLTIAGSL